MQLKRRLVGLREPALGPGRSRKPSGYTGLVGGSRVALNLKYNGDIISHS